jgi:putative glycosyltransferase (TIGR04348 family)
MVIGERLNVGPNFYPNILDPSHQAILDADLMIALHARRSAQAIQKWRECSPTKPLAVVLTGTDLYRDIVDHSEAQKSLDLADRLVVLQELGIQHLPAQHQSKTRCIFQSTRSWKPAVKSDKKLRLIMVGHLRTEKSPETFFEAARQLSGIQDIQFTVIGGGLDPQLLEKAQELDHQLPHFCYLGAQPHTQTRRHIRHAHLLVHPSKMEGGAHVIMEAICSGTPSLASHISGNIGLLGPNYSGYFQWGQSNQLCDLILRCRETQKSTQPADRFLTQLTIQCAERAPLFTPQNEQHSLLELMNELLPA